MSAHGIWLLLDPPGVELFLAHEKFPWFREATIGQLSTIEVERGHILHWPELDVDLDLDRIEHPDHYPLVAAARTKGKRKAGTRGKPSVRRSAATRGGTP